MLHPSCFCNYLNNQQANVRPIGSRNMRANVEENENYSQNSFEFQNGGRANNIVESGLSVGTTSQDVTRNIKVPDIYKSGRIGLNTCTRPTSDDYIVIYSDSQYSLYLEPDT